MHAVMRSYTGSGSKEFFDLLEQRKSEVESLMRAVKGFVSYSLVRSADGGFSVTINQDKAGADESQKVARDWVKQHASSTGIGSPKVSEGSVITHFK